MLADVARFNQVGQVGEAAVSRPVPTAVLVELGVEFERCLVIDDMLPVVIASDLALCLRKVSTPETIRRRAP